MDYLPQKNAQLTLYQPQQYPFKSIVLLTQRKVKSLIYDNIVSFGINFFAPAVQNFVLYWTVIDLRSL